MPDEQVREPSPVRSGNDPLKVALDLDRVLVARQPEPLGEPSDVGVNDDPLGVTELRRDDVRGLAGDSGQPQQVLEAVWHDAVELLQQHPHRAADRLRLLAVEPRGEDVPLELLDRDGEIVLRPAVLLEEPLGDAVHVHVGRLGGEHHRDQELDVAAEAKRDRRVGVLLREALDDRPDPVSAPAETAPTGLRDVATRHCGDSRRRPSPPRR